MIPKCGLTATYQDIVEQLWHMQACMPGHEALAMFLPIMILGFLAAFA